MLHAQRQCLLQGHLAFKAEGFGGKIVFLHSTTPWIKLLQYNIPVITIEQHQLLHRHLYLAGIIVFYGLFKNKKYIRNKLLEISNNRQYKILIGCSKGRLRSPAVWLYARFLGIDAKILKYGVKHYAN